jgi:predicted Fe-S protein YdhL (DUF1289 family)
MRSSLHVRPAWYKLSIEPKEEVLMLKRRKLTATDQLNLFHPPRRTPCWMDVPPDTRAEIMRLLTKMFREKYRSSKQEGTKGGGGHE